MSVGTASSTQVKPSVKSATFWRIGSRSLVVFARSYPVSASCINAITHRVYDPTISLLEHALTICGMLQRSSAYGNFGRRTVQKGMSTRKKTHGTIKGGGTVVPVIA